MKSIFKCLSSLSLPALLLATMPASCVVAQESVEEAVGQLADEIGEAIESWVEAVSYTHLTLPTKRIV